MSPISRRHALSAILLLLTLAPLSAHAAAPALPPPTSRLTVSPVKYSMLTEPGREVTASVELFNSGTTTETLTGSVSDFTAEGTSGDPRLVPQGSTPLSMASWISISPRSLTVAPGARQIAEIRVRVPGDAEPGGHYAAVLFSTTPNQSGQTSIVTKVGTLLLMRVSGQARYDGTLQLSVPKVVERGPVDFDVTFTNRGNVHVAPVGSVSISTVFRRRKVADVAIQSENVLPRTSRTLLARWVQAPIGLYRVAAWCRYGDGMECSTPSRYLLVLPWRSALALLVACMLAMTVWLVARRRRSALLPAPAPEPEDPRQ